MNLAIEKNFKSFHFSNFNFKFKFVAHFCQWEIGDCLTTYDKGMILGNPKMSSKSKRNSKLLYIYIYIYRFDHILHINNKCTHIFPWSFYFSPALIIQKLTRKGDLFFLVHIVNSTNFANYRKNCQFFYHQNWGGKKKNPGNKGFMR